ncbi:hypothetical protein [Lentzea sp.]|uniref:hypothetical protein n=1 Tax=Lentzea sp. TaxID=56099 RepID=UPI002ED61046
MALTLIAFGFTGWMLTQGYTPTMSVATAGAVMAITTTLGRARIVGLRPALPQEER